MDNLLFDVETPLGFKVRCTVEYWNFISTEKHPVLAGKEKLIMAALEDPDEIRRSSKDADVLLFYRGGPVRWTCAVARRKGETGFLITAYPTDSMKVGEVIWTK